MTNTLMALWFILYGLINLLALAIPGWVMGILALIIGILMLVGR